MLQLLYTCATFRQLKLNIEMSWIRTLYPLHLPSLAAFNENTPTHCRSWADSHGSKIVLLVLTPQKNEIDFEIISLTKASMIYYATLARGKCKRYFCRYPKPHYSTLLDKCSPWTRNHIATIANGWIQYRTLFEPQNFSKYSRADSKQFANRAARCIRICYSSGSDQLIN